MKAYLKRLTQEDGDDIYRMLQTIPREENGFINDCAGKTPEEFREWLLKREKNAMQHGIIDGWKVPQTTYWLVIDGTIVGFGKIRHSLTDALRVTGGNIGYSIAPQYRGQGYGKLLLKLLLEEAQNKGIKEILLTIHSDNVASIHTALANGGEIIKETDGRVYISNFPGNV